MSEEEERPYKAEYAKSGRAGCKLCKGNISKDTLRMAKMVQVRNMWEGCVCVVLLQSSAHKDICLVVSIF